MVAKQHMYNPSEVLQVIYTANVKYVEWADMKKAVDDTDYLRCLCITLLMW